MTKLKDLDKIVSNVISQLKEIYRKMSLYQKIDTDLRARALMKEINEKIEKINLSMQVFTRPDYKQVYENYNFDTFVSNIKSYVKEAESDYERIHAFENDITAYY